MAVLVAAWALLRSPYGEVRNLDSRGAAIIAFGDSLTAGYGAEKNEAYPARLAELTGAAVINAGVSGDTTESALRRIEEDVLAQRPRIVIVGLGGNDFLQGVPLASTEANLRRIVREIHGAGAMVVLLGFEFPSLNADYAEMYARVAEEEGCLLVEDVLDGILADAKLRSDAIHPNARGYALLAERVAEPLRDLIEAADARVRA